MSRCLARRPAAANPLAAHSKPRPALPTRRPAGPEPGARGNAAPALRMATNADRPEDHCHACRRRAPSLAGLVRGQAPLSGTPLLCNFTALVDHIQSLAGERRHSWRISDQTLWLEPGTSSRGARRRGSSISAHGILGRPDAGRRCAARCQLREDAGGLVGGHGRAKRYPWMWSHPRSAKVSHCSACSTPRRSNLAKGVGHVEDALTSALPSGLTGAGR